MTVELTAREIEASHTIDDLCKELAAYKNAVRDARYLLADAAHANKNGRTEVVDEFIDRAYLMLGAACAKSGN